MRILIDGDACPQKKEITTIAKQYRIPVIVYIDYAHIMNDDEFEIKVCEIGHDHVDMMILQDVQENDLVITQDYGLASLVLMRKAKVLHVSGMMIDEKNIDELLMKRYDGYKQRQSDKHIRGPKKRTNKDETYFLKQLSLYLERGK